MCYQLCFQNQYIDGGSQFLFLVYISGTVPAQKIYSSEQNTVPAFLKPTYLSGKFNKEILNIKQFFIPKPR